MHKKQKKLLKWSPKISIDDLIDEMIEHELEIYNDIIIVKYS